MAKRDIGLLEGVLARVDAVHGAGLRWFADNEGHVGPRPWRRAGHSAVPGIGVPLVAQRGIHVPSGWPYALSVTATRASQYLDGEPYPTGDGTWLLPYKAHSGAGFSWSKSRWNRGLIACHMEDIPVGVFVQLPNGQYRNLGLALVEQPMEEADSFLLHGPVRTGQNALLWAEDEEPDNTPSSLESWSDLVAMEDSSPDAPRRRVLREVTARERQADFRRMLLDVYSSKCAVTGYDAPAALQAAHIFGYRGVPSHTPKNGLLLRADLHILFDRHLLAIDTSSMRVLVSPALAKSKYVGLQGAPLATPTADSLAPALERLNAHRSVFDVAASSIV